MLCDRCKKAEPSPEGSEAGTSRLPDDPMGDLRTLICEACGSVLPAPDTAEGRGRKMEQLARFGIGVDRRTLLEP